MATRIESLRRAKLVDEPLVRMIISEVWGLSAMETTKEEDFLGVDIKAMDTYGRLYFFDVKRNSSTRRKDGSFTFTYLNKLGIEYKYADKNLVFVDECNSCIYFIKGERLQEYVDDEKTQKIVSKYDASRFVSLPKIVLESLSYYTHVLRGFEIDYLNRNCDENLFT